MTKDVMDAIRERRSTRSFKPDRVEEATLGRILEAGASAPSAGNLQPWRFYVIFNQELKQSLVEAALGQKFLAEAPVVIGVCALPEQSADRYLERGRSLYCIQDTAAAIQNILLAAEGFGLATCWVGSFDEKLVSAALGCNSGERPVALIPLGFAAGEKRPALPRFAMEDIVYIRR